MRILLAEDDARLGKLIKHMLEKENMWVDWVQRGDGVWNYLNHMKYDVIILDWLMPGQSGIEVCDLLRKEGYYGGILMLTAKDALDDRVLGLDMGADDYLVKPFEFAELLARIRAVGRRGGITFREEIVRTGDLLINRSTKTVQRGDREIQLTGREFQLLDLLVQNRGQVLPRDVILDRVWGLESEVTQNTLDAYIRLLRKKIELPDGDALIHNIRGIGYKLEA
ncbi:MAG TPA: DNA-binding response regulator [Firmicutes bacterium]|nr:DNA-binding response regulator [Bacillota bacterium]HWR55109.1 response regulator transcription factor [Negativicutes bacterium]